MNKQAKLSEHLASRTALAAEQEEDTFHKGLTTNSASGTCEGREKESGLASESGPCEHFENYISMD